MKKIVGLFLMLPALAQAASMFDSLDPATPAARDAACVLLVAQLRKDTIQRGRIMQSLYNKELTEEMLMDYVNITNARDQENQDYAAHCTTATVPQQPW